MFICLKNVVKAEEMINTNSKMTQRLFQRNIFSSIILESHERSQDGLDFLEAIISLHIPEKQKSKLLKALNA